MSQTLEGFNSAAEYMGDIPALGEIQLTELAQSFEELESPDFSDIFPTRNINARSVRFEQEVQGLGIMPPVKMGQPAGAFLDNTRVTAFEISPILFRMDDFLDQGIINQMRRPGELNRAYRPEEIIADRTRKMMEYRRRTMDFHIAAVLTGGINYRDPRTNVHINVPTNIPAHNFFSFDGISIPTTAGSLITGSVYSAARTVSTATATRNEGLLFTDSNSRALVPWSHPTANVARTVRMLKQYLYQTNKNKFTRIYMGMSLYTLLHENEYVKAQSNRLGLFGTIANGGAASVNTNSSESSSGGMEFSFNNAGEITHIAGCEVKVVEGMYRDPVTSTIREYWPANRVVICAPYYFKSTTTKLGFMYHCVGEAPNGKPGVWMRSGPDQIPPAPPGRSMQMGDAFLPTVIYPHWLSVLTVCPAEDLTGNIVFTNANINFGTF